MRQRLMHSIPWIVFIVALTLLVSHLLAWERITIDSVTLILLAILLLSPFIEQVRRIRVGEFEAEIAPAEVKKVKLEADRRLGTEETRGAVAPEIRNIREDLLDLLDKDHVLALAKLRMELEHTLNRLYVSSAPSAKQRRQLGLNRLVGTLVQSEILPAQLSGPLREVIYLCNRAIHGEYVRPNDARSILDIGIQVLGHVNSIIEEFTVKPIETKPISHSEVQAYSNAKYRVTTIVPLVENPVRNVRILDQEGMDRLLEGYDEYAEFLVSIEKIDSADDGNQ
jgi:hypothetical protein